MLSARGSDLAEGEFVRAGQEARKAREYARAEKYFRRATDINPQSAEAWAEFGTNSYLAGDYPKAQEHFRKALAVEPGSGAYHYYLALALDKGRNQPEAAREYRRAVDLGGPPEARLGLARQAMNEGDPGLAVEELNRLLAASPDHSEAKVLLAQATAEMEARRRLVEGQSQFANQRLARLEEIVAEANRANRELEARLQGLVQDKQSLEEQLRRAREDIGTAGQPRGGLAPGGGRDALRSEVERPRSEAAALSGAPSELALLNERFAALEARAAVDARTLADRERTLESTRLRLRDLALELGRAALRTRSWEKAAGYFEQAAEVDPRSGEAWYGLGEALFQLGQYERSKQMYQNARTCTSRGGGGGRGGGGDGDGEGEGGGHPDGVRRGAGEEPGEGRDARAAGGRARRPGDLLSATVRPPGSRASGTSGTSLLPRGRTARRSGRCGRSRPKPA